MIKNEDAMRALLTLKAITVVCDAVYNDERKEALDTLMDYICGEISTNK